MRTSRRLGLFALILLTLTPAELWAQPIGTFRWRTEPHCNVVTLAVSQHGDVLTLDGFDEPCDGGPRLPLHGVGVPHQNGILALGLNVLRVPDAALANLTVTLALATGSGIWHDSLGNTGVFAINPASARRLRATAPDGVGQRHAERQRHMRAG